MISMTRSAYIIQVIVFGDMYDNNNTYKEMIGKHYSIEYGVLLVMKL